MSAELAAVQLGPPRSDYVGARGGGRSCATASRAL